MICYNNEEPLVSIIMGAFNAEKTISEAIDSIIDQTYDNWELIVCDDCSCDSTYSILEKYAAHDKRIVVLQNPENKRLAYTLNECLKVAKGKYIARMDADDISLPERLEKQVSFMEAHEEYDCVGTNRIIFDKNGEHSIRYSKEYPSKRILLLDTPFAHPTIMMKKSVYDALNGYTVSKETMRAEDLDLWFRFFGAGYNGYNIQESLYLYREDLEDLKKRSLKAAVATALVFYKGYKIINVPIYKRIFAVKPIIAALIPNFIMKKYLLHR
ncbi:MAG: glycosyltransferase family 2 protein [Pseudobutyrivibrio sp.]|uniref:glycosyltransferase family 2 protein n=1 Tax=Pseudobutyrivibrio sp. TaxID=2014367 RepID=UPI0025E6A55C|nr:glycosyltransferase family 2 protein [Pseudobutyrivibrio sp.]MBQ6464056.1 glycosyltransferase family 2 protein [Pseudobutyrivibrio sp.]